VALSVRRYSGGLIVGEVAAGGRGVYFDREPGRFHVEIRLLRGPRTGAPFPGPPDDPPDAGVREPRRPPPPEPRSGSASLH